MKYKFDDYGTVEPIQEPCKGLIFRGVVNDFMTDKKIVQQRELRFLKRLSCEGCGDCDCLWDLLQEDFTNDTQIIEGMDGIEHNELYQLIYVLDSRDWETGYPEYWHYEIVKVEA